MALIRWEPFREVDVLRRQMDQLFSDLAAANRSELDISPSARPSWVPAIELQHTGSELLLKAEVPGVDSKDLDIQVTQDAVSISGEHRYEKRTESKNNLHSEIRYGRFQRIISLPAKVQNQRVTADLKDGILVLRLPKVEQEQNRVFKVNLGQSQGVTASIEANNANSNTNTESA